MEDLAHKDFNYADLFIFLGVGIYQYKLFFKE